MPTSPSWVTAAPEVPAWLDCTKGALSCQHSSVDLSLAAAMTEMFRWEGTGGNVDRLKAGTMKMESMRAMRRMVGTKIWREAWIYWIGNCVHCLQTWKVTRLLKQGTPIRVGAKEDLLATSEAYFAAGSFRHTRRLLHKVVCRKRASACPPLIRLRQHILGCAPFPLVTILPWLLEYAWVDTNSYSLISTEKESANRNSGTVG